MKGKTKWTEASRWVRGSLDGAWRRGALAAALAGGSLLACDAGTDDVIPRPTEPEAGVVTPSTSDAGTQVSDAGAADGPLVAIVPYDGGPTDVPLSVDPIELAGDDGGPVTVGSRLSLEFALGDAGPVRGILDTGSAGVQVLESALPPEALAAIQLGSTVFQEEFESGVVASGVVGKATVTLGNRTTPQPISVFVFQSLRCLPGASCSADAGSLSDVLFDGYPAIVGVGFRNAAASVAGVGSPIPQLPGQPAFVVEVPGFTASSGTLHIGPTPDELAAYASVQLGSNAGSAPLSNGTPAWDDTAIPACVDDLTASQDYCAGALLDTGAPFTALFWAGQTVTTDIPAGSMVSVTIGDAGDPLEQFDLTVGDPPQPGLDEFFLLPPAPGLRNTVNLGLTPFFRYNVYFDQAAGRIGLLAH